MLRLQTLIHHFAEHQQKDPDSTFFDFINEHYANEINHADDEHNDHENLPFKSKDYQSHSMCKIVLHAPNSYEIRIVESTINISNGSKHFYTGSFLSNIWQPPRLV
jgi:hypothetical protein